jgi:hypothetical protein
MSLARAWKRQLYAASGAALVVPCAMLAALVALALGGGFSQVGVLGQIFSGPPAIGAGPAGASGGGANGVAARSLPVIPSDAVAVSGSGRASGRVIPAGGRTPSGVSNRTGSAGAAPIVTSTPIRSAPPSGSPAPSRPVPPSPPPSASSPSPQPAPAPNPTVVDQVVKVITPVTQQLPAPVGPAATQAVQAAGSAADGLVPRVPAPSGNLP